MVFPDQAQERLPLGGAGLSEAEMIGDIRCKVVFAQKLFNVTALAVADNKKRQFGG